MQQQQPTGESYTYRSMEIIGDINAVIGRLQSKLNICLSPDDTGLVDEKSQEKCELNNDLRLILQSLESLDRRVAI